MALGSFTSGGATLDFIDRDGKIRATFGLDKDGESGLVLANRGGETKAVLRARADKEMALQLFGKEKKGGILLSLTDVKSSLEFFDNGGNARAVISFEDYEERPKGLTERHAPSSILPFHKDGNVVWSAP